jgi:hypothetical protein
MFGPIWNRSRPATSENFAKRFLCDAFAMPERLTLHAWRCIIEVFPMERHSKLLLCHNGAFHANPEIIMGKWKWVYTSKGNVGGSFPHPSDIPPSPPHIYMCFWSQAVDCVRSSFWRGKGNQVGVGGNSSLGQQVALYFFVCGNTPGRNISSEIPAQTGNVWMGWKRR